MTAPLNGTPTPDPVFDPEALVDDVAKAMFAETVGDTEPGKDPETWEALEDGDRDGIRDCARAGIKAFTASIQRMGIRLVPPGAVMTPRTAEEAAAMAGVARQFFEGQQRKSGLVGSVSPGLVLPRGVKRH